MLVKVVWGSLHTIVIINLAALRRAESHVTLSNRLTTIRQPLTMSLILFSYHSSLTFLLSS